METWSERSYTLSATDSRRYGASGISLLRWRGLVRKGSRASMRTTQGEMVVAKDLLVNGPSGTYSHAWTSLAIHSHPFN